MSVWKGTIQAPDGEKVEGTFLFPDKGTEGIEGIDHNDLVVWLEDKDGHQLSRPGGFVLGGILQPGTLFLLEKIE